MATNRLIQKSKVDVYAGTLFDAANDSGGKEEVVAVRNQFVELLNIIYGDLDLSMAISGTMYTPEERYKLVSTVLADVATPLREVIAVMSRNGDASLLTRVYHEYESVIEDKLKLCVVDVVTAVPLDDELRALIKQKAEADLGMTAVLSESIDKSILGGIIMSVKGMRIDASVISQLYHARETLKQTDGGEI
ncbi:MAG: F0F1 ATP synthase subunit delta [Eggerthellaceae bacterium]|nr:F0F1 ATP synthase subunit delta [Eggerthellaceae bacterium]